MSHRYLIDARLIQADKALMRQLSRYVYTASLGVSMPTPTSLRARFNRHRTRFVLLPPEFDIHSENNTLINAALSAGLYPKVLTIDPTHGQLSTITNSQAVAFHPSSVNFRRRPQDFGVNHLAFFTIMLVTIAVKYLLLNEKPCRHSKKLYVWETGPVDDIALLLLCGDCNFRVGLFSSQLS